MLLILCVDQDDDLGRKAGIDTPLIGREDVEDAAHDFGMTDPEDSDLNALYEGLRIYDEEERGDEDCEIAVVTGSSKTHRNTDRAVATQVEYVIDRTDATSAIVVTDGAEDESVVPIVESRLRIDGVDRTIVKQAQNLENAYHVVRQFLDDRETRATVLVPLGILLLIFPIDMLMNVLGLPNAGFGIAMALIGGYFILKGLGRDDDIDEVMEVAREGIYSGKVSLITYLVAGGLVIIGLADGVRSVQTFTASSETVIRGDFPTGMAFIQGAVTWVSVAAVVASVGRIVDEYIQSDDFPTKYLNGPFYIVSMGLAIHAVSGFVVGRVTEVYLAIAVVLSIGIGVASTAVFGGIGAAGDDEELPDAETDAEVEVEGG